jgi:hypothetical protein
MKFLRLMILPQLKNWANTILDYAARIGAKISNYMI